MLQVGEVNSASKAKFVPEVGDEILLQFNPSEYSYSESASYSKKGSGDGADSVQYLGTKDGALSLTLYFDTSSITDATATQREESSVADKTAQIEKLAQIEDSLHRPPIVEFKWGDISYKGLVTSVKTSFTLFNSDGTPIRAKTDVTIEKTPQEKKEKALQSPDRTKTRILTEDVSIWTLAEKEYGDRKEWRRIAKANHIMNPFDIEPGMVLKVPAIVEEM